MQGIRRLARPFRRAGALAREAGVGAALLWLMLSLTGLKRAIPVKIGGVPLTIRTATTDLSVALASLRGEFDELIASVPTLQHNFIVDAGGYIGTAAIVLARAYPEATVVTLEPSSENFRLLSENVKAYPNIRPLNAAISAEAGQGQLRDRKTGSWGLTLVASPNDTLVSPPIEEVQCVTVTELLALFDRQGIDLFKIDIEGGEYQLLGSNIEWVKRTRAICIELHDRIVDGCTARYAAATVGRKNSKMPGEKYLSIARS